VFGRLYWNLACHGEGSFFSGKRGKIDVILIIMMIMIRVKNVAF